MIQNIIDQLLEDSYDMYITRVEHSIRDTKKINIVNYIIVFKAITDENGTEHKVRDIYIFYRDNDGNNYIEYKNIKMNTYIKYDSDIKNFSDLYFEELIKGGIFDIYGYVSLNNANYNLRENNKIDRLRDEFNSLLSTW